MSVLKTWDGTQWVQISGATAPGGGGGGAPTDATYITQTSNGTLTNEQAINSLSDGLLKHASGVLAQAVAGTDYAGLSSANTFTLDQAFQGQVQWQGIISPAQITADQDNYEPSGESNANVFRLSTDASRTITGIASGAPGRLLIVHNIGSNNLILSDENAASSAANRFAMAGDMTLSGDEGVCLQYDSTSSRWRAIGRLSTPIGIAQGGTGQVGASAAFDALAPTTTKGDLIVYGVAADNTRLGVTGTNGRTLVEDSTATDGVKWAIGFKVDDDGNATFGDGTGATITLTFDGATSDGSIAWNSTSKIFTFDTGNLAFTITESSNTIQLGFDTLTADGLIEWQGTGDTFLVYDVWRMVSTAKVCFNDASNFIHQRTTGVVALDAVTTVEIGHDGHADFGGSGTVYSFRAQTDNNADLGGSSNYWRNAYVKTTLFLADGCNIDLGTTTGTKFGTSASDKIGFLGNTPVGLPSSYTPTNVVTDRSYDANSTSVDELADVLGTLIGDLQAYGFLG